MRHSQTALHRDDGMVLGGTAGILQALRISCTSQTHSASKGKTLLISTARNKQAHHKVGGDGGKEEFSHTLDRMHHRERAV